MKKIVGILAICAVFVTFGFDDARSFSDSKTAKFTVEYTFKGIVEGYDHENKTELYIDGKLVATSTVKKETEKNSVSAEVTRGRHDVKVINYAYYEGSWEEHTIANNYSIDCLYQDNINIKKKNTKLKLLFDVDSGTKVVK
ncbi:MAG: hypothetical protein IPI65_18965 [Bacteroidetes bacterium]|nr:hypothetical protein [Bacteroidota bacterium]